MGRNSLASKPESAVFESLSFSGIAAVRFA